MDDLVARPAIESLASPPSPIPPSVSNTIPIRIHKSTARLLKSIVTKLNRKPIGRKVRAEQVITKALGLLTEADFEEIKESTYDSKDRLEIEYRKFCQKNGSISKDDFLKKILIAAIPQVTNKTQEPE